MHEFVRLAHRRAEFTAPGLNAAPPRPGDVLAASRRGQASWVRTIFFGFAGDVLEAFATSWR